VPLKRKNHKKPGIFQDGNQDIADDLKDNIKETADLINK
jgi:hypothetical protein